MTGEINNTYVQPDWCISCSWEGAQSFISSCFCDCGNLIGRITQFWQVIPILAMTVWCVVQAVEAIFSGMLMTSVGFAVCATVLIFAASYVIEHYLIAELHRANAELRDQVTRIDGAATRLTSQLGIQESQLGRLDASNDRLESTEGKITEAARRVEIAMSEQGLGKLMQTVNALKEHEASAKANIETLQRQTQEVSQELAARREESRIMNEQLKGTVQITVQTSLALADQVRSPQHSMSQNAGSKTPIALRANSHQQLATEEEGV
jgi:hypothetical protein